MRKREFGSTVIPVYKNQALKKYLSGYGFANLVCLQAGAAYFHTFHAATHDGADFVQIRIEAPLGGIQRMRAVITYLSGFSTYVAYS